MEFNSAMNVEWVALKLLRLEWWMKAPCHLEHIPCSDEDVLQEFRGDGCPWVVMDWIDSSRQGQVTPTGATDEPHSKKLWGYTVPGGHPV